MPNKPESLAWADDATIMQIYGGVDMSGYAPEIRDYVNQLRGVYQPPSQQTLSPTASQAPPPTSVTIPAGYRMDGNVLIRDDGWFFDMTGLEGMPSEQLAYHMATAYSSDTGIPVAQAQQELGPVTTAVSGGGYREAPDYQASAAQINNNQAARTDVRNQQRGMLESGQAARPEQAAQLERIVNFAPAPTATGSQPGTGYGPNPYYGSPADGGMPRPGAASGSLPAAPVGPEINAKPIPQSQPFAPPAVNYTPTGPTTTSMTPAPATQVGEGISTRPDGLSKWYELQLEEGTKNIDQMLAARGRANSSFALNELNKFQQRLLAEEIEKQYTREWNENARNYERRSAENSRDYSRMSEEDKVRFARQQELDNQAYGRYMNENQIEYQRGAYESEQDYARRMAGNQLAYDRWLNENEIGYNRDWNTEQRDYSRNWQTGERDYARGWSENERQYGRVAALANMGMGAANQSAAGSYSAGNSLANFYSQAGQNQANYALGQGQVRSTLGDNLANMPNQLLSAYKYYQQPLAGGGSASQTPYSGIGGFGVSGWNPKYENPYQI